MATAKRVIRVAQKELGYKENPAGSNRTKYGEWYGLNGQPWCDMFVSWVANEAGAADIIGKFAYTPSHAAWFSGRDQWVRNDQRPKPGDIAFFDFPDSTTRIQHVGIVEKVNSNGSIQTLEGNTAVDNDDNGGKVMRRTRFPSTVVGYGRPDYDPPFRKRVTKVFKNKERFKRLKERLKKWGFKW